MVHNGKVLIYDYDTLLQRNFLVPRSDIIQTLAPVCIQHDPATERQRHKDRGEHPPDTLPYWTARQATNQVSHPFGFSPSDPLCGMGRLLFCGGGRHNDMTLFSGGGGSNGNRELFDCGIITSKIQSEKADEKMGHTNCNEMKRFRNKLNNFNF